MHTGRVLPVALCAAVAVFGLAGCASQTGSSGAGGPSSSAQPVASFGDADKDRTVTVHRGQPIRVSLDTTNWRFAPATDGGVIHWQPQAAAPSSGACTVINQCGSVSIAGVAMQAGRTTVHATREQCGELRLCDPNTGSYTLTIVVVA